MAHSLVDRPIVLISIFRNSAHYVQRYFDQVNALREHVPVDLVIAEGDSTDRTWELLKEGLRDDDELIKADHHGPTFDSVDNPVRWKQISWVYNQVLERVPPNKATILVESDLIWPVETPLTLLRDLGEPAINATAVAPLSMQRHRFYDIWGYRGLDGERFNMHLPYHRDLDGADFAQISSAGSCIAMRPNVARDSRFGDDGIVDFCASVREKGPLFVDSRVKVTHP